MSENRGIATKQDAIAVLKGYGLNPFKTELQKKVEANHHIVTYLANTGSQTSPYPYSVSKPTFEDIATCCVETITILRHIMMNNHHNHDREQLENSMMFLETVRRKKWYYLNFLAPLRDVFEPLNVQYEPNKHSKI